MATMRKNVVKRGDKYSYVIELPRSEAGKRRQKWVSGFPTAKAAQRAYMEAQHSSANGMYVAPSKKTLSAFATETWLPSMEPSLRRSTFLSYSRNLRLHVLPGLGSRRLTSIEPGDLNALYAELLATGGRNGAGLSHRTVQYQHMILRHLLSDAVRWGAAARNIADMADPPKIRMADRARQMLVWDAETLGAFHIATRADRLAPLWVFLSTTGTRRGEALGLRWTDVDLTARTASIVQTLIDADHEVLFGTPKTARGRRSLSLDTETADILRVWRARQAAERLAYGPGYVDNGLVFTQADGQHLSPKGVTKAFQRRARGLGLQVIRLHDLRHTYATLALTEGINPKVVSERLGHASVSITLDLYSHVTANMQEDAAERVAARIFGFHGGRA